MAAQGEFFRLVDQPPPGEPDFLSNAELKRLGIRNLRRKWSDECAAAGLSVTKEIDDLKKLRESLGPMRNKKIASGKIDGPGVMKATPSANQPSHHTWWRPVGDVAWKTFRIVA